MRRFWPRLRCLWALTGSPVFDIPDADIQKKWRDALALLAVSTKPSQARFGSGTVLVWSILGGLVLSFTILTPAHYYAEHWRALGLAFLFGCAVGSAEIIVRYRDEPILAALSPFGILYLLTNGAVSLAAALIIFRSKGAFPSIAGDEFLTALAGGFGGAAVMRTRLAILKDEKGEDVSAGPDAVIKSMLGLCDSAIDRFRARARELLAIQSLPLMHSLGAILAGRHAQELRVDINPQFEFAEVINYLNNSLLAFQNPDGAAKENLERTATELSAKKVANDTRYLAFSYTYINVAGERQFSAVLENAIKTFAQFACSAPTEHTAPEGAEPSSRALSSVAASTSSAPSSSRAPSLAEPTSSLSASSSSSAPSSGAAFSSSAPSLSRAPSLAEPTSSSSASSSSSAPSSGAASSSSALSSTGAQPFA